MQDDFTDIHTFLYRSWFNFLLDDFSLWYNENIDNEKTLVSSLNLGKFEHISRHNIGNSYLSFQGLV